MSSPSPKQPRPFQSDKNSLSAGGLESTRPNEPTIPGKPFLNLGGRFLTLLTLTLLGLFGLIRQPALAQQTPETTPAPDPAVAHSERPESPLDSTAFQAELVELVNQARLENGGLPPLKRNDLLDQVAGGHSENMAGRDFFSHCDVDTQQMPWDRMTAAGYEWVFAAENIAAGYFSPEAVMDAWMDSGGHRANILSEQAREIGIGYISQPDDQNNVRFDRGGCKPGPATNGPYFDYWTQDFGQQPDVFPAIVEREAFETTDRVVSLYIYAPAGSEAVRICNASGYWSEWQPFAPEMTWTLSPGNGVKTIHTEVVDEGNVYPASDSIILEESYLPSLSLTPLSNPIYLPLVNFSSLTAEPCPGT